MTRKLIYVAILIVIVAINPMFGPIVGLHGYRYGEAEMRHAVEGAWTLTPAHGAPIHFTLRERAVHASGPSWFHQAAACGSRSFVHTAGACMDTSDMELAVASSELDADRARFFVAGLEFVHGELEIETSDHRWIHARIAPDGSADEVTLHGADKTGPATLARM
ncbi:MAG TPA: hypothetical protein VFQ65_30370 [Kofleriaceae bacterium]|nr:hypothetical protein [Kofleriaceae bacterium]